jgi:hypothetical protein
MRTKIGLAHETRIRGAFAKLTLGERQLLLLGLWIIGEQDRVDPRLLEEWGWLKNALASLSSKEKP